MKKRIQVVFFGAGIVLISAMTSLFRSPLAKAQSAQAVVFAPPSNVRVKPNGEVLCSITSVKTIDVYPAYWSETNPVYKNYKGWYQTNSACGIRELGYIHKSQVRIIESTVP